MPSGGSLRIAFSICEKIFNNLTQEIDELKQDIDDKDEINLILKENGLDLNLHYENMIKWDYKFELNTVFFSYALVLGSYFHSFY